VARTKSRSADLRGRLREDVARLYPEILKALEDAIKMNRQQWGSCPECKHKVPVSFPDLQGRVKALQFLVEAGYGKPPETLEISAGLEADLDRWRGYFDRMTEEESRVMRGFLVREQGLQPALTVGEGHAGSRTHGKGCGLEA
jgi:hypothetical protein